MGRVNRRIGKSSETANTTPDGTGGGVLDSFLQTYFNRSGNLYNDPGGAPGIEATGGVVNEYTDGSTNFRSHTFTSSGTFSISSGNGDVEYLVVAGGGGGGGGFAGAGGAGGLKTSVSGVQNAGGTPLNAAVLYVTNGSSYTVTVGAGGAGGNQRSGVPGSNSVFGSITAHGGGRGGGNPGSNTPDKNADDGGSGGSAGMQGTVGTSGSGNTPPSSPPQGNDGGTSYDNGGEASNNTGGGGGAGAAGQPGGGTSSPYYGGAGGAGVRVLIGGAAPDTQYGVPNPPAPTVIV